MVVVVVVMLWCWCCYCWLDGSPGAAAAGLTPAAVGLINVAMLLTPTEQNNQKTY